MLVAMLLLVLLEVELGREVVIVEGADGLVGLVPEVVVHQDRLWEQVGLNWADWLQVRMACWVDRLSATVRRHQLFVPLIAMLKLRELLLVVLRHGLEVGLLRLCEVRQLAVGRLVVRLTMLLWGLGPVDRL